jgi:uncharacterized Zn-binding protein involved in type VI secretion
MPAARVGDPIAHSNAGMGMLLGALVGVAAGAVLIGATVATGGLVLVAAVGAAASLTSFGGLSGMYIGAASMGPPTGALVIGSPNVFINGRPATMTFMAMAACSKDPGPIPLATGSSTVMINFGMAGREAETMGCSAKVIAPCSPDVIIGGPSAQDPRVTIQPEVPQWAVDGLMVLGVVGIALTLPFAYGAVGLGGIIGGGAIGYGAGLAGGAGMRALGESMGLSKSTIRAMEVAGQFGGGMLGGRFGAQRFGRAPGAPMTPLRQRYLSGSGGRWGSSATRAQNDRIASGYERQGYRVTGGAGRAPEEWIPGPGGGTKGGSFVDMTATKGGQIVRVQTVTTLADGVTPTPGELAAAGRIRSAFPNDQLILIPKGQ